MHDALAQIIHFGNPLRSSFFVSLTACERLLEDLPVIGDNFSIVDQIEVLRSSTALTGVFVYPIVDFFPYTLGYGSEPPVFLFGAELISEFIDDGSLKNLLYGCDFFIRTSSRLRLFSLKKLA